MIELRHLKTLHAIHAHGTLARAAKQLCVSQSALSHQLRDLERVLGLSLMNRRLSPVAFSPAGERLLTLARTLLPLVEAAERELDEQAQDRVPRVHVVLECHSCVDWLLPALSSYREAWPQVDVDLRLGASFDPWPGLERADFDVVVTTDRVAAEWAKFVALFRSEVVLLVPRGHRLERCAWVAPQDLQGETLVSYPVELERLDVYSHFLQPAGVVVAQRRFAELTLMVAHLVACGHGVAALPRFVLPSLQGLNLSALRLGQTGLTGTLYAAVRARDLEVPALKAFLKNLYKTCHRTLQDISPPDAETG